MPTMHNQFPTPTPETTPGALQQDLAINIENGYHTPTYEEFVEYQKYVDEKYVKPFRQASSSIKNADTPIPTVYVRRNPDNNDEKTFLSEQDYELHTRAARPEHWLLDPATKADMSDLLAAKNLAEVDRAGRHRSPMATGDTAEADAETLSILQADARRRIELDREIRIAQLWANSRYGARFGLEGKTIGNAALSTLKASSTEQRLTRIVSNPFETESTSNAKAKPQETQPEVVATNETEAPVKGWRRMARRILSLF